MSVDFAIGSRATLGDPGGESRPVAMFPYRLVRAFVWGNASPVPGFRRLSAVVGRSAAGGLALRSAAAPASAVFSVTAGIAAP